LQGLNVPQPRKKRSNPGVPNWHHIGCHVYGLENFTKLETSLGTSRFDYFRAEPIDMVATS